MTRSVSWRAHVVEYQDHHGDTHSAQVRCDLAVEGWESAVGEQVQVAYLPEDPAVLLTPQAIRGYINVRAKKYWEWAAFFVILTFSGTGAGTLVYYH